jgi:hypothetical protein
VFEINYDDVERRREKKANDEKNSCEKEIKMVFLIGREPVMLKKQRFYNEHCVLMNEVNSNKTNGHFEF